MSTASPISERVALVHASVAGRTRFEIAGLYRSTRLKQRLESALAEVSGIKQVTASDLTGRLLVFYGPDITIDEIVAAIEEHLDAGARFRSKPRWTAPASSLNIKDSLNIKQTIDKITGLFGSMPALLYSLPIFRPSPAQSTTNEDTEPQNLEDWHLKDINELLQTLGTSRQMGLDDEEASQRLQRYGLNSLTASAARSDLSILLGQFNSPPVFLLGGSAVIAILTGGMLDAAVILGVVMINSAIGFVTERQAEKTISSLSETGVRTVRALRGGEETEIDVEDIVPGDILVFTPGSYVAADARILSSHRLSVDESALTGESLPVNKDHHFLANKDTALADRRNMAYMGTHISGGNGQAVVVATAAATELGQIQTMVGEAQAPETPMQKQLDKMGTTLAILSGGVCALVFGVGIMRGYAVLEMLKSSVSLAVAAVPEGLPAVATTTLAMGISDMRKHNVAVRHLDAVETLGSVQVFCMDKTGTLTMNRMAVVSIYCGEKTYVIAGRQLLHNGDAIKATEQLETRELMQIVSLCSDTEFNQIDGERKQSGSPTEMALVELALNAGIDVEALRQQHPRLLGRDRAEGRPYMTTLHPWKAGKYLLAVKGSPEEVLAMCDTQIRNGRSIRLSSKAREAIISKNDRMAGDALRVLGVAYRELDEDRMPRKTEKLVWLGLAGMADPMREGMDKLIKQFHQAGIDTVMITGDQAATAQAIGKQLGLSGDKPLQVLESSKLENVEPELLAGLVKNVHVFARVSPAHKLRIVQAFQDAGRVVAMTGDGINDGPALKAADIGVAMGESGTNVARDVSDVVLEDDNLHTMAIAVSQGRTIYNNIRKMIHFMVSTNLTEIEVMLAGIATGMGQPMNSMQLLWINLVTDIFPGLALSMEPAEKDIMQIPPRKTETAIIAGKDLKKMTIESGIIGVGTMAAYIYGLKRYGPGAAASTLAFNTLTLNELAHAYSSRSEHRHVFSRSNNLPSNPYLNKAILVMTGLQAIASFTPGFRQILGTTPLGPVDLLVMAGGVLVPLIVNESLKPPMPEDIILDEEEMNETPSINEEEIDEGDLA
ncbi:MAG: cation-transporting P-type ATPase [Gammaproteobacteria bacterium]|nr:cation-transporting P-type ATPase [Gammaproteobacteria bacterium]